MGRIALEAAQHCVLGGFFFVSSFVMCLDSVQGGFPKRSVKVVKRTEGAVSFSTKLPNTRAGSSPPLHVG